MKNIKIPPKDARVYKLYEKIVGHYNKTGILLFKENDILTEEQTKILRKYFIEGKTIREIAKEFGLSRTTIANKMVGKRGSILSKLTYWSPKRVGVDDKNDSM